MMEMNIMATQTIEIPLIIDGKEIKTGDTGNCVMPHNHQHVLATYHKAGETEVIQAIDAAMKSWKTWSTTTLEERTKIFRKVFYSEESFFEYGGFWEYSEKFCFSSMVPS